MKQFAAVYTPPKIWQVPSRIKWKSPHLSLDDFLPYNSLFLILMEKGHMNFIFSCYILAGEVREQLMLLSWILFISARYIPSSHHKRARFSCLNGQIETLPSCMPPSCMAKLKCDCPVADSAIPSVIHCHCHHTIEALHSMKQAICGALCKVHHH